VTADRRPQRRDPNEPPDVDGEPDPDVTRDDVAAEADRAADRHERALWGDR